MSRSVYKERDKGLLDFFCPVCGCNKFNRTHRNIFERSYNAVTLGNKANKKFECTGCGWTVLLSKKRR